MKLSVLSGVYSNIWKLIAVVLSQTLNDYCRPPHVFFFNINLQIVYKLYVEKLIISIYIFLFPQTKCWTFISRNCGDPMFKEEGFQLKFTDIIKKKRWHFWYFHCHKWLHFTILAFSLLNNDPIAKCSYLRDFIVTYF